MVSALANIVAGGNSATQSLSDAFANANQEFGMADRLIGGYQVTDQVPVCEKEEEEPTTDTLSEEVKPTWSVDYAQTVDYVNGQNRHVRVYQLSLLSDMQTITVKGKNGQVNGQHQNGQHQNGASATHATLNGHVQKDGNDQKGFISPPQLEMALGNNEQVRSQSGKSVKRRRKAYRGPSLFDWLNKNQPK